MQEASMNRTLLGTRFFLASCLDYSSTLKMEATCSSETSAVFIRLHSVISEKTELLKTTEVENIYSGNKIRNSEDTKHDIINLLLHLNIVILIS
jgi:hypothetical protein